MSLLLIVIVTMWYVEVLFARQDKDMNIRMKDVQYERPIPYADGTAEDESIPVSKCADVSILNYNFLSNLAWIKLRKEKKTFVIYRRIHRLGSTSQNHSSSPPPSPSPLLTTTPSSFSWSQPSSLHISFHCITFCLVVGVSQPPTSHCLGFTQHCTVCLPLLAFPRSGDSLHALFVK